MRLSVVTLGVADRDRSAAFYRALLGCEPRPDRSGVTYFALEGTWLALYPRPALAGYFGLPAQSARAGAATLSFNLPSPQAVDALASRMREAGATVSREPGPADWGGHIACLLDPDGHPLELVYNPKHAP